MSIALMIQMLAKGMVVSGEIFALTLIGGLPLGILVCLGRRSRIRVVSWLFRAYISVLRGTPLMLQLFVVYFGPFYLLGISIGSDYRFIATAIAFILNYAAYFAEIYRSGIDSIPVGQYEAAEVLGFSKTQTFFKIILPQVVKRILPTMANEVITLIKDTSLAFAIGLAEMFTTAQSIAASQRSMFAFVLAAGFYYVFNLLVEFFFHRAEKRLSYYHE